MKAETKIIPVFNLEVPTYLSGVNPNILDPRNTYEKAAEWGKRANDLAEKFIKNFEKYTDKEEGKSLIKAGPSLMEYFFITKKAIWRIAFFTL